MDNDKYVQFLMTLAKQNKIYLPAQPEDYIELQDFPVKGATVKLKILGFSQSEDKNFFEIYKVKDYHSIEFAIRGHKYIKTWNSLPNQDKENVFQEFTAITSVTVCLTRYGVKKYMDFKDVLVVGYHSISVVSTAYEKFKYSEFIVFRSKKRSEFSAYVSSATTP